MTIQADHCEAKLHGFRRTQDGVVVSFVVHPQQVPECLALDPLGTRYQLAMAQIGDDEKPVVLTKQQRTSFHNMSIGQQAALACRNVVFQKWISADNEHAAAVALRRNFDVKSRADIPPNEWVKFYADFEEWAGDGPVPR